MHSSRMHTGRSLTVCRSLLWGGGMSASWGRGCLLGGACFLRGVCFFGGCLLRGVSAGGVSVRRGCLLGGGGCGIPTYTEADIPPPLDRITDACKNITLATTSLRPVIKQFPSQLSRGFKIHTFGFQVKQ